MTSKNSFWAEQLGLLKTRMLLVILSALFFFIYYPIGVVLTITKTQTNAMMWGQSEAHALLSAMESVSHLIGLRQFGFVGVIALAIFAAIQGFSYLYRKSQVDFYESQPVNRGARFRAIYINGILVYLIPYVVFSAIGVLIAAGMRAMTIPMVLEWAMEIVRMTILYIGVYTLSTLGALIAGSAVIAVLMALGLLLYEAVLHLLIFCFAGNFLRTFYTDPTGGRLFFSPVYYYSKVVTMVGSDMNNAWSGQMTYDLLFSFMKASFVEDLLSILLTVVLLVITYQVYKSRRNEQAGTAIAFSHLKPVLKVMVSFILALGTGYLISSIYSGSTGTVVMIIMILAMGFVAFLGGCFMEAIFDFNIKAAFRGMGYTAIAGLASIAVLLGFRFDVIGYDRFVPRVDQVESSALITYGYFNSMYHEDLHSYYDATDYYKNNMFLKDTETVIRVAALSQANRVANWENVDSAGYNATVLYRMKSGRKIYRNITIPYDIDKKDMDAILGSEEYKEGYYQIYKDEALSPILAEGTLQYDTGYTTNKAEGTLYTEFAEAYREDLKNYNFSVASSEDSCGTVSFVYSNGSQYVTTAYEVYPSYANTIGFLKANRLYMPPTVPEQQLRQVNVTSYPATDASAEESSDKVIDPVTVSYKDTKEMTEILKHSVSQALCMDWKPRGYCNDFYTVEILTNIEAQSGDDVRSYFYAFKSAEIPDFVVTDTMVP